MRDMTEKEELSRKILLQQQAITLFQKKKETYPPDEWAIDEIVSIEKCRDRIRANRRRLWEIDGHGNTRTSSSN